MSSEAYAGIRRRKQTPWRVKFGDALVSRLITIGGIGTIGAVLLVVLVLLATAWPLLRSPSASQWHSITPDVDTAQANSAFQQSIIATGSDEFGKLIWQAAKDGSVRLLSAADGQSVAHYPSPGSDERQVSCHALSIDRQRLTLGFTDGTYQTVQFVFHAALLVKEQLPDGVTLNADQPLVIHEQSLIEMFGDAALRQLSLEPLTWSEPVKVAESKLLAIDYLAGEAANQFSQAASSVLAAMTEKELVIATIESRENMLSGAVTQTVTTKSCSAEKRSDQLPLTLMLANRGAHAIVAWDTGTLDRYAIETTGPRVMESASGLPGGGRFTAAAPMIARQTLLLGDAAGVLHGWNIVQTAEAGAASDGYRLTATHQIKLTDQPIKNIASSGASHLAMVTSEDATLSLVMTTTDSLLRSFTASQMQRQSEPKSAKAELNILSAFLTPKNDGLIAVGQSNLLTAHLDVAHPEATLKGLFGKVWYEGHAEPKTIWQSSAGTEQSEPKFSLIPLIFGTLKATLYAMIFSVPLALMSAIYTSEFLTPALRSRIKPVIELMASLPSVILGFIAALVLAPLLQQNLCAVLLALFIVPTTFIYAAHFWNLLPLEFLVRGQIWRLWLLIICLPIGLFLSMQLAPWIERWLFAGDIVQWMSGSIGSPVGGWMLLMIPVVAAIAVYVMLGPMAERNRRTAISKTPRAFAARGVVQLLVMTVAVAGVALLFSMLLSLAGFDLRSSLLSGYQERNSLLVGAVLGFCIIPLIYTLADDALQSVPAQLRSASLGCGATPWQTTVRVVVPSAMSGMFSAVMIGFGRAVGETMVVLMAAGNTPIMEWNPFNGFRTLSATLATELPEAAKGSTHFRTLFLAALLLFALTLVANTVAEYVRIRFRRRGSQL